MSDIFGDDVHYGADKPFKEKKFYPWHRPRKHFVRIHQWVEQLEKLIQVDMDGECEEIAYLGLPGTDLLDIRCFHDQVCLTNDVRLKFLGFNTSAKNGSEEGIELNTSLQEVLGLDYVDSASKVIPDDFRDVANKESLAFRYANDFGGFDVVNIDLCDGFTKEAPHGVTTYYSAFEQIRFIQSRRNKPWLLFLTTKTAKQDVNEDVYSSLIDIVLRNVESCDGFKEKLLEVLGIPDDFSFSYGDLEESEFTDALLLAVTKWIITEYSSLNPSVDVEITSLQGYKVFEGHPCEDLFSIAIKFSPHQACVPSGSLVAGEICVSECRQAKKAISRIARKKNVDALLAEDSDLMERMVEGTVALLKKSRYDETAARSWFESGCPVDDTDS